MTGCPFCAINDGEALRVSDAAVALFDRFPVAEGHVLVVPRRHVPRVEQLEPAEWADLFGLVHEIASDLAEWPGVDGVNIGVNSGAAAGQTVEHAHVHVIPRRIDDVPDARGGVRHVIPGRAVYWTAP